MLFRFNSDSRIAGDADTEGEIRLVVEERLQHVLSRLSRVEVHVAEINGPRGGADKRCAVELRPNGLDLITATERAETVCRPLQLLQTRRWLPTSGRLDE